MKKKHCLFIIFIAVFFPQLVFSQQMTVKRAAYFRKSQPLSEMAAVLPGARDRSWKDSLVRNLAFDEHHPIMHQLTPAQLDPVRQISAPSIPNAGPILNFAGIGNVNSVYPPDTEGDVGRDYYFQMINLSFAIYDKQGNLLFGPVNNSTLWNGFIGPWTGTNDGDPIVLYDELANRWIASQFAVNTSNGTYWQLIAISETSDPLGSYYQYAFEFPAFNDYPKFGIWPDAYYASFNLFGSYVRVAAAAFERDAMLVGDSNARMILFDLPPNAGAWSMLPSDFDGNPPPTGAPNYFAYFTDDGLGALQDAFKIWEFHVDWNNVNNSTFQPVTSLAVAPFDAYFCDAPRGACIPQPNTNQGLETLSDRLMYRLQYRNFGTYQTMVACHSVDFDGQAHAGIRWYEFRKTDSNPWEIYQQGTWAPDDLNRWMPSIAMNTIGDIALGYSVSSESYSPSIRYTGRTANAPLGQMNLQEAEIITGSYAQSNFGRWGDYAMMAIDPSDDTSFWFTTEYIKTGWKTRIAKIQFDTSFSVSAFAGPDTLICNIIPYNNLHSSAQNYRTVLWTTSGDGHFNQPNEPHAIYFLGPQDKQSDSVKLTLTAFSYDLISVSSDSMTLFLHPSPYSYAGKDTLICVGDPAYLHGTAYNTDSIVWSTYGDGYFSEPNLLNTIYFPGTNDINKGHVNLRLTAMPTAPCFVPIESMMKVNIHVCTGTNEISKGNPVIEINPNPAHHIVKIHLKGFSHKTLSLRVMDMNGNILFSRNFNSISSEIIQTIDLNLVPTGTYIIQVIQDQQVTQSKLIKN
ncbi:MAG TPA: T9SS type A sorting domain-containing protein [Bacteroidales bacterium]|nr:T9SS type A sorting domain-containing protein [Bacteroidales bacterium]MDI9573634.1 T9SS type A sorting domain-containing protein [Bacteroidota bacterium]MBP9511036.1 T9SS type A sorting domain-containing protein [Bacteroidales bacterium]MBP9587737.1 T9SS type A sorting domain-containing protein [Bacteroidales bacterium]NMD15805.1 T9SS type A sorting domain-containing protein [Bacteroidales bacterium]